MVPAEIEILLRVCDQLERLHICYMLTGSFAMHFHANPRMTRDIDIVIKLTQMDAKKLCAALGSEVYSDEDMAVQSVKDRTMFNAIFQNAGIKVDFVIKKNTEYANKAFSRRKAMDLLGKRVVVSTAEDLVISKLDWARDSKSEMQIRDVSNLLKIKALDLEYVENWVARLNLKVLYAKAKSY